MARWTFLKVFHLISQIFILYVTPKILIFVRFKAGKEKVEEDEEEKGGVGRSLAQTLLFFYSL